MFTEGAEDLKMQAPKEAVALDSGAQHPTPHPTGGISNDAAGFASRYGPLARFYRAS
jgi:hypothetical protein